MPEGLPGIQNPATLTLIICYISSKDPPWHEFTNMNFSCWLISLTSIASAGDRFWGVER